MENTKLEQLLEISRPYYTFLRSKEVKSENALAVYEWVDKLYDKNLYLLVIEYSDFFCINNMSALEYAICNNRGHAVDILLELTDTQGLDNIAKHALLEIARSEGLSFVEHLLTMKWQGI